MKISKAYVRAARGAREASTVDRANLFARKKKLRYHAAAAFVCLLSAIFLAGCGGGGTSVTVEIQPSTTQMIDESQTSPAVNESIAFTASVSNDVSNLGVTWNLTTDSTGCSGSGCGTLSNVTAFSVTYTAPSGIATELTGVVLEAVSKANSNATQTVDINVQLIPSFSNGTLTQCQTVGVFCLSNGSNGVPYTTNNLIAVTGGVTPYTFQVSAGSLPPGLSMNHSTGTIVGKPSCPALTQPSPPSPPCPNGNGSLFQFTVEVTDNSATPVSVFQQYQITVTPPPTLSITTSALPPGIVNTHYSNNISITGGVTPITWSVVAPNTCSVSPNGLPGGLTLNSMSGNVSGVPTALTSCSFTIQVTDSSLPSSQSVTKLISIAITNAQPLQITSVSPLPAGSTATAYGPVPLTATGGVAPYTWSVILGQLPSGLALASDGTISGTPVLATNPPSTYTFTIQVADAELPAPMTVSKIFTMQTTAGNANPNSLISGAYTFLFNGFDVNGPVTIIGAVSSNGSGGLAGTEDSSRLSGILNVAPVTGTYSMGSDGRGTMELIATSPISGALVVTDYRIVLDSSLNVHFYEDNSTNTNNDAQGCNGGCGTHGAGIMKPEQTPAAGFAAVSFGGNYAFRFTGRDSTGKQPAALLGVFRADGSASPATITGTCDFNLNGAYSSQPISGTFADAMGVRGTAELDFVPGAGKSQVSLQFIFYFITPNDLFFMENDTSASNAGVFYLLSGEVVLQQPGFQFTNTALAGTSVATGSGIGTGGNSSVLAGLLTSTSCDGQTAASVSYDENNAGAPDSPSFIGTCLNANTSNGRVQFTNLGPRLAAAYLTGPGTGFFIGSDMGATTGLLEQQAGAPPFAASSVADGYTLFAGAPVETQDNSVVGQVFADGTSSLTGALDEFDPPSTGHAEGTTHPGQPLTSVYTVAANARGTITTNSPVGFPTNLILYVVSPGTFRAISDDASPGTGHPQVFFFTH